MGISSKVVTLALPKHKEKWVECNGKHPLSVPLADREIVLSGWKDFGKTDENLDAVGNLDVFFGLDSLWKGAEVHEESYSNPFVQQLHEQFFGTIEVDNILKLHISDRGINLDVYEFIRQQFEAGKSIGFGCMAGHGRTGWVYAKLIKEYEGCSGDEAVRRVRKRFCPKCVESEEQTKDLGCVHELPSDELRKPIPASSSWGWANRFPKKVINKGATSFRDKDTEVFPLSYNDKDSYYKDGKKDWGWWDDDPVIPAHSGVKDFQKESEDVGSFAAPLPTRIWCGSCHRDLLQAEADEGWCPYCKGFSIHFDFTEPVGEEPLDVEDEERISKIAKVYRKWMNGDTLTGEEMRVIDDSFVSGNNKLS